MAGTKAGGLKAAATNKLKYGDNFYSDLGKKNIGIPRPGAGFAADRERARLAGAAGGRISRRRKKGTLPDTSGDDEK